MYIASAWSKDVSLFQQSSHRNSNVLFKSISAYDLYLVSYHCIHCDFGPEHVHTFRHFGYFRVVK